jgi:hypothetical protein
MGEHIQTEPFTTGEVGFTGYFLSYFFVYPRYGIVGEVG